MVEAKSVEGLIAALQRGDGGDRPFETLYRTYYRGVVTYFERHGIDAEQSRDLAQEVFLAIHSGIGSLRDATQFRSWMFGIARHKMIHHLAARRRTHPVPRPAAGEPEREAADPAPGALDTALDQERRVRLREALEDLPQQMRACVRMNVVDQMEYAEIAERLGVSVNSVKVHMHRARQHLAARLGPLFDSARGKAGS